MKYFTELKRSMEYLASNPKTFFLGQAVEVPGTAMSNTLKDVKKSKLIELPVAEEMQMGITTGMVMNGLIPVSIYPRWNFLILALNQLVNHLDKIKIISKGNFKPKVIVRVLVGSKKPLDAGLQHTNNYVNEIKKICKYTSVYDLKDNKSVLKSYKNAIESENSSILVEYSELYDKI